MSTGLKVFVPDDGQTIHVQPGLLQVIGDLRGVPRVVADGLHIEKVKVMQDALLDICVIGHVAGRQGQPSVTHPHGRHARRALVQCRQVGFRRPESQQHVIAAAIIREEQRPSRQIGHRAEIPAAIADAALVCLGHLVGRSVDGTGIAVPGIEGDEAFGLLRADTEMQSKVAGEFRA